MEEKNQEERQVPELKLDEQQRISIQTKDIPLMINGKEGKVTIKKLGTGVRNRIQSECTQTKIVAGKPIINVNHTEIQEKILFACIVNAPFEKTLGVIKELPTDVADYLSEEYTKFAEPDSKKKDGLEKD
ncbi:MAG: hypothetical protein ACTSPI_01210 [Candidatus Heimdallarchaeaceae archaeon]